MNLYILYFSPLRLPPVSLPRPEYMLASLPNAFLIAIVSFVISFSVADLFAKKYGHAISSSQVCTVHYILHTQLKNFNCLKIVLPDLGL